METQRQKETKSVWYRDNKKGKCFQEQAGETGEVMLSKGLGWIKRNILNQKRQGHWYILKEKEQFSGMLGFKKREELIEKWEESRKRKLRQYNFACDRV